MSRSGYNDDGGDGDNWSLIRWRGAVNSALKGQRGQAFLRELAAAMDAMPDKRLIAEAATADGCMCTLGVVAAARGMDLDKLDADMEAWDWKAMANDLGISAAMAREIMWENDEAVGSHAWVDIVGPPTRSQSLYRSHPQVYCTVPGRDRRRWIHMRKWVQDHIIESKTEQGVA